MKEGLKYKGVDFSDIESVLRVYIRRMQFCPCKTDKRIIFSV